MYLEEGRKVSKPKSHISFELGGISDSVLVEVIQWAFKCLEMLLSEWDIYHRAPRKEGQEGGTGHCCLRV